MMNLDAARNVKIMTEAAAAVNAAMTMGAAEMMRNARDAVISKGTRRRRMTRTMMAICPNMICGATMK